MLLAKDNIRQVLASMTLEEKASLLVGSGWGSMLSICLLSSEKVEVPGAAGVVHSLKRFGIPPVVMADGPACRFPIWPHSILLHPHGKWRMANMLSALLLPPPIFPYAVCARVSLL